MNACLTTVLLLVLGSADRPQPALGPEQVVRIVVDALRSNNTPAPNTGVFTAYQFSSPANHANTGPYGNFLQIAKHPDFAPLLRNSGQSAGPINIEGNRARQVVSVRSLTGLAVEYEFVLTRQTGGPFRDCWMMDGVILHAAKR